MWCCRKRREKKIILELEPFDLEMEACKVQEDFDKFFNS